MRQVDEADAAEPEACKVAPAVPMLAKPEPAAVMPPEPPNDPAGRYEGDPDASTTTRQQRKARSGRGPKDGPTCTKRGGIRESHVAAGDERRQCPAPQPTERRRSTRGATCCRRKPWTCCGT